MPETMKVHAFGVNEQQGNMVALLTEISNTPLENRHRGVGAREVRVEHIERQDNGLWAIDFGSFRGGSGPGKASLETPIEGININDDQDFVEETACLFDPNSNHLIVQYNHYGAKIGAIQEFFNTFNNQGNFYFDFIPAYDADTEQKFENRQANRRIKFAIDPRMFDEGDFQRGTPLASAIKMGQDTNSARLELNISVSRARTSRLSQLTDGILASLKRKAEDDPDAVSKLEVGIEGLDGRLQVLDLIGQRLLRTFDIELGNDRRLPRANRYQALEVALAGWRNRFV